MEKRLKYLLGFLVVGLSLFNQTFGGNLKIDGVTIPVGIEMDYKDFGESADYRYNFSYSQYTTNGTATPYVRFFGFNQVFNSQTQFAYNYYSNAWSACPSLYTSIQLNNSVFGQELYNGSCYSASRTNKSYNMPYLNWGGTFDSTQRVLLGNYTNFGNAFALVGTLSDPSQSPKYGFGGGYFTDNNFVELDTTTLDRSPLRLFYYRNTNGTSPLDDFSINTNSGQNITNFFAWQYFTPSGTRYQVANMTSAKNFGDLGGSYSKGLTTAGYGVGYSFGVRKSISKTMTRDDFDFVSVGSKCLQTLYIDGMSDPNSQTKAGCQQIGFMILKGKTYVSSSSNQPVIVLSKDIYDHSKILYETFDCYEDEIQRIVNPQYCNSVSHGYLTVDGTGAILPFTESGSTFTVTSTGGGILNLFVGDFRYGIINNTSNGFQIQTETYDGGTNLTYTFTYSPTPQSSSILDYYRAGLLGYTGTVTPGTPNEGSQTQNSSSLYLNCLGPVYNTPDGLPPAYCFNENGELDPDRFKNCYTVLEQSSSGGTISHNYCNLDGYYQEVVLEEYGSGYVVVPGQNTTNILDVLNDQGFNEQYFNNYLNTKGYFFKCPFSYDSNLTLRPKLASMLTVDPNLPINCVMAGYSQGKNFISNQFDLHIIDNGPILNGNSDQWKMFYRFVDFILLFGILFMFIKIFRLFK